MSTESSCRGSKVAHAGPRVLAYSHDGYGLGHLRRNLRILTGLRRQRPDVRAVVVTGANSAERLAAPFDIECVRLPSVVKVANGRYAVDGAAASFEAVLRLRSVVIADAVREFRPDLLLVDRYPRGMHDELALALRRQVQQKPRAPAVLGLRDILDSPAAIRSEWQASGHSDAIRETYGTVLCYGDPAVYDSVREYGLPSDIAERIRFTGYLADELPATDPLKVRRRHDIGDRRLAVCTLGGGKDAAHIAQSFLSTMGRLWTSGWTGVLITGPYMPRADVERLHRHPSAGSATVIRVVDDVPSYLAAADAAVCMGGYNTTCELLGLAVPAVIVPRIQPRREQIMRTERLAARGLLWWVHPDRCSADALAAGIETVATAARDELAARISTVAHSGIATAARHLAALLPGGAGEDQRATLAAAPGRRSLSEAGLVGS